MLQGATTDDERSLIAQLRAGQAEMLSHISAAEKPAPKIDWKRWEEVCRDILRCLTFSHPGRPCPAKTLLQITRRRTALPISRKPLRDPSTRSTWNKFVASTKMPLVQMATS